MRALVNEEGSITDTYSYTAYGELTARTGDTENHYLYTGEYYDGASGLYYLRARYMNPGTGSFISMDSYTGSIYDPASLHRYTYVKDNPVMYKDPSGYKPDSLTGTSIALGIREVLSHVVELNCIGILNSIINATAATLMGGTEDEVLKVLFSGYILGAGMAGLAYFVGAVYALTYAQVMLAEMAAGEAASFAMMVVSAFDGDSSSVVQYEIMNMLYFMSATLMYNGSLPKNDMKPSKNGWNCDVWNAGSQGSSNDTINDIINIMKHGNLTADGKSIITQLDDKTRVIFRMDVGENAHSIKMYGYDNPVNHINIEIQVKSSSGKYKPKWDFHIILDNLGNVIDSFITGIWTKQ